TSLYRPSVLNYRHDHRSLPPFPTRRSSDLNTKFLLNALALNVADFARLFPNMAGQTFAFEDTGTWMTDWTLFFWAWWIAFASFRSEEHTSELQSRFDLVCRLLLEKKNMTRQ